MKKIIIIKEKEKERKKKKTKRIKIKKVVRGTDGERQRMNWREICFIFIFFFLFLFYIYGNRTVDFYQTRRQSWSTRRELRVGTKSLAFRHTSRGRKFFYLCYFEPKCYVMA